jgi:hypothetical protein
LLHRGLRTDFFRAPFPAGWRRRLKGLQDDIFGILKRTTLKPLIDESLHFVPIAQQSAHGVSVAEKSVEMSLDAARKSACATQVLVAQASRADVGVVNPWSG